MVKIRYFLVIDTHYLETVKSSYDSVCRSLTSYLQFEGES